MNKERLEQMEIKKWESYDKRGHAKTSNPHFDSIYETGFLDGFIAAQEYIKQSLIQNIKLK